MVTPIPVIILAIITAVARIWPEWRPEYRGLSADGDLAALVGNGSIFGGSAEIKLERLQRELQPLSERCDVVVANPPCMGTKNMNAWLGKWVKEHYADVKGDLF